MNQEKLKLQEKKTKQTIHNKMTDFMSLFTSNQNRASNKISKKLMKGENENNKDILIQKYSEINRNRSKL